MRLFSRLFPAAIALLALVWLVSLRHATETPIAPSGMQVVRNPVQERSDAQAVAVEPAIITAEVPNDVDAAPEEVNGFTQSDAENIRQALREIRPRLLSRSAAEFPWQATAQGISNGYVILEFTVTENGTVADIIVRESTAEVFDESAIAAVQRYLFQPNLRDGAPARTLNVAERIEFDVADPSARLTVQSSRESNAPPNPIVRVNPTFPDKAVEAGIVSGYVVVSYSLNTNGKPQDVIVIESSSPLLEEAAVDAARRSAYQPRMVDGQPVVVEGIRYRVDFSAPQGKPVAQSLRVTADDADTRAGQASIRTSAISQL